MSAHVEVSPGGIGFVRTSARKSIPGEPATAQTARRRTWLSGRSDAKRNGGSAPTATNQRAWNTEAQ